MWWTKRQHVLPETWAQELTRNGRVSGAGQGPPLETWEGGGSNLGEIASVPQWPSAHIFQTSRGKNRPGKGGWEKLVSSPSEPRLSRVKQMAKRGWPDIWLGRGAGCSWVPSGRKVRSDTVSPGVPENRLTTMTYNAFARRGEYDSTSRNAER